LFFPGKLEDWKTGRLPSNPPIFQPSGSQLFFSFGLEFNDFNAPIVTARRAHLMGQARLVAFRASDQVARHECIVAAPPAFAALT
jgi:hypothetical protein